jgi:ubiquinone biosynthesis protein UbiJ
MLFCGVHLDCTSILPYQHTAVYIFVDQECIQLIDTHDGRYKTKITLQQPDIASIEIQTQKAVWLVEGQ